MARGGRGGGVLDCLIVVNASMRNLPEGLFLLILSIEPARVLRAAKSSLDIGTRFGGRFGIGGLPVRFLLWYKFAFFFSSIRILMTISKNLADFCVRINPSNGSTSAATLYKFGAIQIA